MNLSEYKVVAVPPTEEMVTAGFHSMNCPVSGSNHPRDVFDAMISAAPDVSVTRLSDLSVELCSMTESNGRVTWCVFLSKDPNSKMWDWFQIYSDTIEGRARYECDSLKYFLGQAPKPDILAYDTEPNDE